MSNKRTILIEAALVTSVLVAGITTTNAAQAAPVAAAAKATNAAHASVKIESKVLVERTEKGPDGQDVVTLHAPSDVKVTPGDKLLFVNAYKNTAKTPVTGFVVNNPIHPAVSFAEVDEDWALVSVDGGKKFGKLAQLTVKSKTPNDAGSSRNRSAVPLDVTQVRWVFKKPIAAGASGELHFRGVVK